MKKTFLCLAVLAAICFGAQVHAATAPATTATTAAKAPTGQQNRMKSCAAQYHAQKIAKSQYKTFMSGCLKNPATPAAAATPAVTTTPTAAVMAPAPSKPTASASAITPTAGPAPGGMAPATMAPPPGGTMAPAK